MKWTFPLFRIFGIPLRMHWLMAILIAVYLVQGAAQGGSGLLWMAVTLAILLVSILFHELAHCWMAIRLGGSAEQILLWPLGGLAHVRHPGSPSDEIKVSGIGPIASLVLAAVAFGALPLTGISWDWQYLVPFHGWFPAHWEIYQVFILHTARINLILALFNLCVPVYPLDGGKVLMAFLIIRYGRARAGEITALIAIPAGCVLAVLGFAQNQFFMGLIGIWVLIEAFQLRKLARMGELSAHPAFSEAPEFEFMPDPPRRKGWFARWRARRAQKRAAREMDRVAQSREKVDTILEKVSREGIGSLTSSEKKQLNDASRRSRGG
jgi:Zn-dependent protease